MVHPNKHITSFLTHPFISQTKKSLCRVDCCMNLSQHCLSPLGRKIIEKADDDRQWNAAASSSWRSAPRPRRLVRNSGWRSSGDAIGRDQRESVMRGVRRNPGSLSSTTTWESTRGSGASQREHDEHKDGAMAPQRNERPTDGGKQADGSWR